MATEFSLTRFASGLNEPEGPCVLPDGTVFVCESERAVSWHRENGERGDLADGIAPNGAAFAPDGSLCVAEWRRRSILRINPDRTSETLHDRWMKKPLHGPNDICFLPDGSYYFTDPARDGDTLEEILNNPNGRVFHVSADGVLQAVAEGLHFSNGLLWTRNRKKLLVCESGLNRIVSFAMSEDGTLSNMDIFIDRLPGYPDGMCIALDGCIYVAVFGSGKVFRIDESGQIRGSIELPGKAVTNCALGGHDHRTLYITEKDTGCLYATRVKVPGMPLFPFENAYCLTDAGC